MRYINALPLPLPSTNDYGEVRVGVSTHEVPNSSIKMAISYGFIQCDCSVLHLREISNQNESCADFLQCFSDGFVREAAVTYTLAVGDQNEKLGGSSSEWIFRCLHQSQETIAI